MQTHSHEYNYQSSATVKAQAHTQAQARQLSTGWAYEPVSASVTSKVPVLLRVSRNIEPIIRNIGAALKRKMNSRKGAGNMRRAVSRANCIMRRTTMLVMMQVHRILPAIAQLRSKVLDRCHPQSPPIHMLHVACTAQQRSKQFEHTF